MSFYDDYLRIRQRNSSADEERKKRTEQASSMTLEAKKKVQQLRQERYSQMSDRERLSLSLAQRKKEQQDFLSSDDNVSFFQAVSTDKTMRDWVESRKKKNRYADSVSDAEAQLTAYDEAQKRARIGAMSYDELEGEIASLERQIQKSKDESAGALQWLTRAFGGDVSGAVSAFDEMVSSKKQRAPLESELSALRAQRDEKKSQHEISQLPADVVSMLDEYNSLQYDEQGFDWAGVASALSGQNGGGTNAVQYSSNHMRKTAIAKKLTDMGYENFAELAEYRRYLTDKAVAQENSEKWSEVAKDHHVLAEMGAVAATVPSAVAGAFGTIEQLGKVSDLSGNPYSAYYSGQEARNAIRDTISNSYESGFFSRNTKRKLYQALSSGADSLATGVSFGGLGLGKLTAGEVVLGLGAGNEAYTNALKNGYTPEQAISTGTVAFVAETLWEHLTLGKLSAFEDLAEHTVKAFLGNIAKNSFTNMTEEMATEVTNIVYDYMANGGVSEFYQTYEGYIQKGMSEAQAKSQANRDMAVRVADAGLSGALIGGVFSGINSADDTVKHNSELIKSGERIHAEGEADTLVTAARSEGVPEKIKTLADKVGSYGTGEDGTLKRRQYRTIGKLDEKFSEAVGAEAENLTENAIRERLVSLGERATDIAVVASAIRKQLFGKKITSKEKTALSKSTYGARVLNEATSPLDTSSEWVSKTAEKIDALYERRYTPDSTADTEGTAVSTADEGVSAEPVATEGYSDATKQIRESLYAGGQDRKGYDADFDLFYSFGKQGIAFDAVKDSDKADSAFTLRQRENAYQAGVNDAEVQSRAIIKEVKSIDADGDALVVDTSGNEYKLSDLPKGNPQAILYGRAVKTGDTVVANLFVRGYNPGTSIEAYERAFTQIYSAGKAGPAVKFTDFIKGNQYASLLKYIDGKALAQKIYEAGQSKANTPKKKKARTKADTGAKGEYVSRVSMEDTADIFYEAVAKKTGLDIERVQAISGANGEEANASFVVGAFKVMISATAENEYANLIHELGHVAQEYAPESYQKVRESLITYYLGTFGYKSMEDRLRDFGEMYKGMSKEEINEEFLNDAISGIFSTDEGIEDFLRWLQSDSGYNEENKKTIIQRISEWLKDILDMIRDIISTGTLSDTAKDYMTMQEAEAQRIREMFLSVLDEVAQGKGRSDVDAGDTRFSLVGKTADGIEVYETSEEIKALPYSERKKIFHDLMSSQFFGRTAKFTADGETYYARFDESSIDKNIYGDKVSSKKGWMAKISVGADGDIFELIENARYDHSAAETGKKNASHKKVKQWDYFVKTVQIDGKLYDVLINIRKKNNENFVYSIRLWENKKRVSPALGTHENSSSRKSAAQHSDEGIVSQGGSVVNSDTDDTRYSFAGKKPNKSLTKGTSVGYTEENEHLTMENRAKPTARSSINWVYKQGLFSIRENKLFFQKISEIHNGSNAFYKNLDGEYMLPIGNKIIFTDGDYDSPHISRVIEVMTEYATEFEDAKRRVFACERGLQPSYDNENKIFREMFGDEFAFEYRSSSDGAYGWPDGRRKGKNRKSVIEHFRTQQQREGNSGTGSQELWGEGDDESSEVSGTDTRHSLKRSLGISEGERKSLVSQITELERINDDLRLQLRHPGQKHILSMTAVQSVARQIKKDYKSTVGVHELSDALFELYSLIANEETVAWDIVDTHLTAISEMVLKKSKYQTDISEENKAILRDIRSVKIKLSDKQKTAVSEIYGSYNEFRKKTMGTLVLSDSGIDLDTRWQELCETYPGLFSADVSDADQPLMLVEAADALRSRYTDDSGFDIDSAEDFLKASVYEMFFSVPETKLLSEEYKAKLTKLKVDFDRRLSEARAEFKTETQQAYKKAKAEYAENLKDIRQQQSDAVLRARARMEMRVQGIADTRLREKKRNQIIRQVRRLDTLLRNPNNQRNIPEGFQSAVLSFCEMFTDNTSVFDYKRLDRVRRDYERIKAENPNEETSISGSYDFEIKEDLEKLKDALDGKRLSQLTLSELETVLEIANHFATVVKNETEIFLGGKKDYFSNVGEAALSEISARGTKKQLKLPKSAQALKKGLGTDNKTPVYFFEEVGGTLQRLFKDIRAGQDKYIRSLVPAKKFFEDTVRKYSMQDVLNDDTKIEVQTKNGTLHLTVQQLMLIYATAKREALSGQESKHLLAGGIVFESDIVAGKDGKKPWKYAVSDYSAHQLTLQDIMNISDMLTAEQKGFADALVGYLSSDMAMLGNEVSMELYGVRKFKERYYIPFNSAESFGYRKFAEQSDARLKTMRFTKSTVQGAATPLVLSDFTKVWAEHVERMCAYSSMVIPLENFTRVWNYKTKEGDSSQQLSVESAFSSAFGADATKYVVDLMRDLNGNIMTDKREDFATTLITKFKKNAVFASLSVMVQQPSAIGRALVLVEPKYFAKTTFTKRDYEQVKKYAPVAVLKEVGGFDTTSGRNMSDWLTETKPENFKDKIKAFFSIKDSSYRDEWLGKGPQYADEKTWCHIFNAVVAQVRAEGKFHGEELMWEAGRRFGELVDKTQVYDSVIVRSGLMRSKAKSLQITTAFMAEPTVSLNMLADAVRKGKAGDKKYLSKTLGALFISTLINALAKSVITSIRDDDEDKSLIEKYIGHIVGNFIEDANPLSWIPFVKDVWSIFNGYTAERAEMSLIGDVYDAIEKMMDDDVPWNSKLETFAGSIGAFLGVPVKNVWRDVNAVLNAFDMLSDDLSVSRGGVEYAIASQLPRILETLHIYTPKNKAQRLYDYWVSGDAVMYNRVAKEYKNGTAIKNALKGEIKNRFLEGDLSESQVYTLLSKLGYDENKTYYTLRDWQTPEDTSEQEDEDDSFKTYEGIGSVTVEESTPSYTYLHDAISSGDISIIKQEGQDLFKRGAKKDKVRASLTSKWKSVYTSATLQEKKELRQKLYATGAYDSLAQLDEYLSRWEKSK